MEGTTGESDLESPFQLMQSLPSELLDHILTYLAPQDLARLNLASSWTYNTATPLLWRHVTLTDRDGYSTMPSSVNSAPEEDVVGIADHHDDTPLLRKLIILATNPWIASHVQVLEHRCHCPPPGIFAELPRTTFSGSTMSSDPRTWELVKRAVKGMMRVHTLRIVGGHVQLVDVLLRCFFDAGRKKQAPIRRLWLEGCRISGACDLDFPHHPVHLPEKLDFGGLESLRLRRLPMRQAMGRDEVVSRYDFTHARTGDTEMLQDGQGGVYSASTNSPWVEMRVQQLRTGEFSWDQVDAGDVLIRVFALAMHQDDEIFEELGRETVFPSDLPDVSRWERRDRARLAWRGLYLDPENLDDLAPGIVQYQRERLPSARVALNMFKSASDTLTSLCLDWVLAMPHNLISTLGRDPSKFITWLETYADLFALRFPNLRAFQYRNAVTIDTMLPFGLYLLGHASPTIRNADLKPAIPTTLVQRLDLACLEFLEAHPNLQCLAWPMEAFFPSRGPTPADIADRVAAVIGNLGRTLLDLRVDTTYNAHGERQSDEEEMIAAHIPNRNQRRRFIAEFATHMRKLTSIKIEGGMPRDERRETLRALSRCPLEKVVLIGVCCPIGNTWGARAVDLLSSSGGPNGAAAHMLMEPGDLQVLEAEHKDAIHRSSYTTPTSSSLNDQDAFTPTYGWPPGPPMLHTVASLPPAAGTINSLKFCGYKGAPVLYTPTPITPALLSPLKYFHALRELVLSFTLLTGFEGQGRDHEIIRYWLDARSPQTTSLVLVRSEADEEAEMDMGAWERELKTKFAPEALAGEVVRILGPCLSEKAKGRKRGVKVRASVCLGDWGGIFDLDVRIGKVAGEKGGDVCIGFEGPREELEEGRRRGKLEGRRWF